MMPWSKIVISAEDQTGPAFNSARNNVKGFSGDVAASTKQLQSWGQALLGGITVGAVAGKLVAVQREFDVLNSSLITVTGSSAAAEREMAWIKQFAKETPFGLAQATDGFVKMKALGLEPTRASLTSFGNTAAAMGKDLKQMIEAVADASTGEFERLKEFGIKARKEGDSVSLTFQGVTTTVRNSAEEITKYLEGIGNNQFGGAMAERAKTLDGAIAELGDTWDELFRTVNQNATGTLIADTVRMATAAVSDLTEVLGAMTRGADDSARATGALTTIQNGLGTVFETVAVLGLNVKYVLVQIGNELGGLAAQAAAVATLQFSQAAEIGRMMKEDAAAARAQVDAGTARILNARQDANNRGSALAGSANAGLDKYLAGMNTPPRPTRPASGGGGGGGGGRAARPRAQTERESEEARAYAQAMEAIAKAQMTAAISGENYTATQQRLVDIMTSPEWRNMPEEWRLVIAQQGEAAILAEQHAAAQKKANDARKAEAEAATRELESLQSGNAQMREQIDMLGLTTAEQTAYTQALNESAIAKLEDKAASLEMLDADSAIAKQLREQVAALKDRNALLGRKAEKEQMLEAQRAQLDMWKSIDQTAHDVFVNIFEDGAGTFKRLGQTLKAAVLDMLYQMTVKRWIIQIGASFTGQPLSVVSQALGGGQGGIGGMISNGNSLFNLFTGNSGGVGSLLFGSSAAYGLGVPGVSLGSQQAAMLAAQTGPFGWGGLSSTASAANISGASWMSSAAAGLAAIAAPLLIGSLIERNSRDRFSGAAYATSGGNDPFVNTIAGSTRFDYMTGDLPDRAALLARLEELGAPMEAIGDWNDRALTYLMESAAGGNSENGINWTPRIRNMRDTPDFYRGAGYAHPEELGWWNNKDNANLSTDPALIQASRDIALSIIAPLEGLGALIGDEAAYRATVGFANRGEGNGLWAGMNLQRDGQNVADWVNTDDFHSVGEAVRAMYSTALGALDSFDLPGWADKQVTAARAALDALEGENMGQEAAALYAQTTAGIEQMYRSIQMLIDIFPDFSNATQDAVYALAELMGGMDGLQGAYSSYIQNFWSEEERLAMMRAQMSAQLSAAGFDMPDLTDMGAEAARQWFRGQVEAQDANTESGRAALAALLGLAGAFAELTPLVDAATDAVEDAARAARSHTDDVWNRLNQLFNEQIDNWRGLAGEARKIFDLAGNAARQLRGGVVSTRLQDARTANAYIDQALAGLRASGALPDADELGRAIEGARAGLTMDGYVSVAEFERDQLILAGKLGEMGDTAGVQLSFAEQQVKLLEQQRDFWRKQLDAMRDDTLLFTSIDEGVTLLADALRAEQAAQEAARAAAQNSGGGGGGRGAFGGGPGGGPGRTPEQIAIEAEELREQDWWGDGDWYRLLGWRLDVASEATGISPDDLAEFLKGLGMETDGGIIMPRYAGGGMHSGGLRVVGERGWELEATGPSRIWNQQQLHQALTSGGSNDAELADLLREVLRQLGAIRADTKETSDLTYQQLSLNKRLTSNGSATRVEVLTP